MERRLILAIALSLLVLLSWSALVTKYYHVENKGVTKEEPSSKAVKLPEPTYQITKEVVPLSSLLTIAQEKFDLMFIENKGALKEAIFKDYKSTNLQLNLGLYLDQPNLFFKKVNSLSKDQITFVHEDAEKQITKRFIFHNSKYSIDLEIITRNLSSQSLSLRSPLILGVLNFAADNVESRYQDVTVATKDKTLHLNAQKETIIEDIQFLGLRNRYFCAIIEPASDSFAGFIQRDNAREFKIGLQPKELMLNPGQQIGDKFRIYLGPQDLKTINSINPNWSQIMHYGTFNFISHLLLQILEIIFGLVHNWGWSIILLSVIIYLVVYPLTLKQLRSMKEMQALQPHIEELKKNFKDNPQRLNKEIMELYRQHKVNPFGGCLPLILQIPIFFALYQALLRSIALKGANFLWIKDLSEPDRLFIMPFSLPVLSNEINILPILMAILMFFQQRLSLKSGVSGTAEQQKLMLFLFPLMFGFIFYHMPAGLVLYWFINSMLMLLFQLRTTIK